MGRKDEKIGLIINADDFGMSSAVNEAILSAFQQSLISSTSIMTNMPGFEEASAMTREHGLGNAVGVHINLVEGRPVTSRIRQCRRFCNSEGLFPGRAPRRVFRLAPDEMIALREEVVGQIQACIDRDIMPTHLDSHHHAHTGWGIGAIVMNVASSMNIPAVRINGQYQRHIRPMQRLYKWLYNRKLSFFNLAHTKRSLSIELARSLRFPSGISEIVVHPRFDENMELIDGELKENLKKVLECFWEYPLVSYASRNN